MRARLNTLAISGTGQAAAMRQPLAGHRGAVAHVVERRRNRSPASGARFRMITGTFARRTTGSTVEDSA